MKLFQCQSCGQSLHFENTVCLSCGRSVGYLPDQDRMIAVEPDGALWAAAAADGGEARWRFCHNWELSACNWLVAADPAQALPEPGFCSACRHNRTVADLTDPENHARWMKTEAAKRRLIYGLDRLGLPRPTAAEGHPLPLVFDFLADAPGEDRVLTGHANGVVTIALIEADDATRERMRTDLGEAYRTLLGHFRHEVGHYYWDLLVRDGGQLESFRALFGDESADYGAALQRHYETGAPAGWEEAHVSTYATMHPWEDWAETWAHYLHMADALETAAALGIGLAAGADPAGAYAQNLSPSPWQAMGAAPMLAAWMPLTVALNSLNRSMGQPDLYPFVLPVRVQEKLGYVHDLIAAERLRGEANHAL